MDVSVGESVRILRELQRLSQNDLSKITGIPQSTISAIEDDRVNLGCDVGSRKLERFQPERTLLFEVTCRGLPSRNAMENCAEGNAKRAMISRMLPWPPDIVVGLLVLKEEKGRI